MFMRLSSINFRVIKQLFTQNSATELPVAKNMDSSTKHNLYSTTIYIPIAAYKEIKDLPNQPEKYLIDVREPHELAEVGRIPTSINIPLDKVETALSDKTSVEEFLRTYGRAKPNHTDYIIFYCRSGRRSQIATEISSALGYGSIKNYKGSWIEWAEMEGLQK